MGLLLTDLRADFSTTKLVALDAGNLDTIADAMSKVEDEAAGWFASEAIPADKQMTPRRVDMRYDITK